MLAAKLHPLNVKHSMPRALRAIAQRVLDQVFPWVCVGCEGAADFALCDRCMAGIRWIEEPTCPRCGLPLASAPSHLCGRCAGRPPAFSRLRAIAAYRSSDEHDPLGVALRALKYAGRRALAQPLSMLLADRFPFDPSGYDLIAPVPLHLERLRSRGFNQALLLAREPARRFAIPVDPALMVRLRSTPPQVGLDEAERRRNVHRAFALRPGRRVDRCRILLIDDVCTSTATVDACARLLTEKGAASVDVLVAARALRH
ncbi:MAG TPA: ComF family protein [Candidatus Binatia bacterium]|nr:ComF family protein [Candidatus Binatia bacterium]